MAKILLLSVPLYDQRLQYEETHPPLGLAYIAAVLERACHQVKVRDMQYLGKWETVTREIGRELEGFSPDIVGITCYTDSRWEALNAIKLIKTKRPEIITVLGGPHASILYQQIMENFPEVDMIVIGEGEYTMLELAQAIDSKGSFYKINGLVFRENGRIIKTDFREVEKCMDNIPFPARHHLSLDSYEICKNYKNHIWQGKPLTEYKYSTITTSRGCTARCTFCATSHFWGNWRGHSAEYVLDEIEILYKDYGIRYFVFNDDALTINKQRMFDICDGIIKRKLVICWVAATRIDSLDKDLLKIMKDAGCYQLGVGIESVDDRLRESIGKRLPRYKMYDVFKWAEEIDFNLVPFLMIGNPCETKETVIATRDFLKNIKYQFISLRIAVVYPGTPLYELAKGQGFIDDSYWLTKKETPYYTYEHSIETLRTMCAFVMGQSDRL